ncbi:MAG: hypothetical protein AABP62_17905 [Planctomycetota bacterium]
MTASLTILDNIRIASPCSADWSAMVGDDRSRFCGSCQKHVYNLSAMTADEATQLIRERDGNLCGRLFRRADGTVLTSDCPVGARAVWRRTKQLVVACAAAVLIGVGGIMLPNVVAARSSGPTPTGGPVVQKTLALWDDLLVWMGVRRRYVTMGGGSIPPFTTIISCTFEDGEVEDGEVEESSE